MPDDSNRTGWRNLDGATIRAALNEPTRIEGSTVNPVRFESLGGWANGGMITVPVPEGMTFSTDRSPRDSGYVVRETYLLTANWGPILRRLNDIIIAPRRTDELDRAETAFITRYHLHTGRVLDAIRAHRASPDTVAPGYPKTLREYTETGSADYEVLTEMRRADRLRFYRNTTFTLTAAEYEQAWQDYRISRGSITRVRRNEAARIAERRAEAERRRAATEAELERTRAEREREYQRMARIDDLMRAALFADPDARDLYGGDHDVLDETPAEVAAELASLGVESHTIELRRDNARTRIARTREARAEQARVAEIDEANMRIMLPIELMEQWSDRGYIEFRAASGHWYRLVGRNHGLTGNVHIIDEPGGRMQHSVCAHPEPPAGVWTMAGMVLGQYLALTTDEDAFLRISNRIEGDFPYRQTVLQRERERMRERDEWRGLPPWAARANAPGPAPVPTNAMLETLSRWIAAQMPHFESETRRAFNMPPNALNTVIGIEDHYRITATRTPGRSGVQDQLSLIIERPDRGDRIGWVSVVPNAPDLRVREANQRFGDWARITADRIRFTPASLTRFDIAP